VHDFLAWAAAHRHCPQFTLPARTRADGAAASQDDRWALATRLLHDTTLDLTDRAAGCLVLLYGQQLSRITAITTSQITTRSGTVHVRLGEHDVPVPEPLGAILTELIRTGRTHTGTGSPAASPWLFPGMLPGQPITPAPSACACAPSASTPWRAAAPRSPTSPPSCPQPSWLTCSAWPPKPPSTGCAKPAATGPDTPPN
jgi:integrase